MISPRPTSPSVNRRPPIPLGPFLVAGLGRAGRAAVQALCQATTPELVFAWDSDTGREMRRVARALESQGVRTCLGAPPGRREVRRARTIVKSPGLPFHASVIQRGLANGSEIVDELELGWRLSRTPMLAVTGTNGKSTVAGLIDAVMVAGGHRSGVAGNTEFGPALSGVRSELDWIVCEASSFQLEFCDQLLPEVAVFTNLTPEHLGTHRTLERYGACKRRMFVRQGRAVPRAVINVDDAFGRELAADVERLDGVVSRTGSSASADFRLESSRWDLRRATARVSTPSGRLNLRSALPGEYNAHNALAALAAADLLGIDREVTLHAISAFRGPPGRFEHIDAGQPFDVIVDFAHTPDGFAQFLSAVRTGVKESSRLAVVLGYAGRPGTAMREMGALARRFADELILTTSGFLGFPPMPCLSEMLAGARSVPGGRLEVILDRRRAIERALRWAARDDAVVIPGRGALPSMQIDPRGVPVIFDDRQVTRDVLRTLVSAGIWSVAPDIAPGRELNRLHAPSVPSR